MGLSHYFILLFDIFIAALSIFTVVIMVSFFWIKRSINKKINVIGSKIKPSK